MMTKDGITFSKYSYQAMEIGFVVSPKLKALVDLVFKKNVGEDSVFPTKNGGTKGPYQIRQQTLLLRTPSGIPKWIQSHAQCASPDSKNQIIRRKSKLV